MKPIGSIVINLAILIIAVPALLWTWPKGTSAASTACVSAACDLNGDGVGAKLPDYAIFLAAFGSKKGDAKFNAAVDFDGSGSITTADFAIFQRFCPLQ